MFKKMKVIIWVLKLNVKLWNITEISLSDTYQSIAYFV